MIKGAKVLYCLKITIECIIPIADMDAKNGHGLSETKWNG
jgi:hypothetical protein